MDINLLSGVALQRPEKTGRAAASGAGRSWSRHDGATALEPGGQEEVGCQRRRWSDFIFVEWCADADGNAVHRLAVLAESRPSELKGRIVRGWFPAFLRKNQEVGSPVAKPKRRRDIATLPCDYAIDFFLSFF